MYNLVALIYPTLKRGVPFSHMLPPLRGKGDGMNVAEQALRPTYKAWIRDRVNRIRCSQRQVPYSGLVLAADHVEGKWSGSPEAAEAFACLLSYYMRCLSSNPEGRSLCAAHHECR